MVIGQGRDPRSQDQVLKQPFVCLPIASRYNLFRSKATNIKMLPFWTYICGDEQLLPFNTTLLNFPHHSFTNSFYFIIKRGSVNVTISHPNCHFNIIQCFLRRSLFLAIYDLICIFISNVPSQVGECWGRL